jgi:hypothetical protein
MDGPGQGLSGLFGDLILYRVHQRARTQPASQARCLGLDVILAKPLAVVVLCTTFSAPVQCTAPGGDKQVRFDMRSIAHAGRKSTMIFDLIAGAGSNNLCRSPRVVGQRTLKKLDRPG